MSERSSQSAVVHLLARTREAEDLRQATAHVARREQGLEALEQSVFLFRLGAEWMGLPPALVDEVVEPRPVHSLPHRRDASVRGLVNVRGRLTVCVALEPLFQLDAGATGKHHRVLGRRLVVLAAHGQRLAFEADEVHGAHRYAPASVGAVPATVAHAVSRFSTGVLPWHDQHAGLLDADLLLHAIHRRLG